MKTPVINSLCMAANEEIFTELEDVVGRNHDECEKMMDPLDKLLDSLPLDKKTKSEIFDMGASLFWAGEEYGFRRGFRGGAQLMRECF